MNDTKTNNASNFVADMLVIWAALGDKPAFVYLHKGEQEESVISFGELAIKVRQIAFNLLHEHHLAEGNRVIMMLPTGIEFVQYFFACIYAGIIVVPMDDTSNPKKIDRLCSVIVSTDAKLLIINERQASRINDAGALAGGITELVVEHQKHTAHYADSRMNPQAVAYLQFTSGSTSTPKGVVITHHNLSHQTRLLAESFAQSEHSVFVSWLPLYHDQGLVSGLLLPASLGATSVLMSPLAFAQKPIRWLQAVAKYKATTSGGPNFGFAQLADLRLSATDKFDLSSWTTAFCGAEPIRMQVVHKFIDKYQAHGFLPCSFIPAYGLAESTLVATRNKPLLQERALALDIKLPAEQWRISEPPVSCGAAQLGMDVQIVDPETETVMPEGEIGEIWLSGPSMALGYWRDGRICRQAFQRQIASIPQKGFFATGDLGLTFQGELYVTGRLDEAFKLKGKKIFFHELEASARHCLPFNQHSAGSCAAVDNLDDTVSLLISIKPALLNELDIKAEARHLAEQLAFEHDVLLTKVYFVKERMPLTSSGKLQRRQCNRLFYHNGFSILEVVELDTRKVFQAAADEQHCSDELAAILCDLLRAEDFYLSTGVKLHSLGLSSVEFIQLQHKIESTLGKVIELKQLMSGLSVGDLDKLIKVAPTDSTNSISAVRENKDIPLPRNVVDMLMADEVSGRGAGYLFRTLAIRGPLNQSLFEKSFTDLVTSFPILQSYFRKQHEQFELVYDSGMAVSFRYVDKRNEQDTNIKQLLNKRVQSIAKQQGGQNHHMEVFQTDNQEFYVLFAFHHAICDFWSLAIYLNAFMQTLTPHANRGNTSGNIVDYSQYQQWYADYLLSASFGKDKEFWLAQHPIQDAPVETRHEVHTLPVAQCFELPARLCQQVHKQAKALAVTQNSIFIVAYELALSIYNCSRNIGYSLALANRPHHSFADCLGMFANIVPSKSNIADGIAVADYVRKKAAYLTDILCHQSFPISDLSPLTVGTDKAVIGNLFHNTVYAFHRVPFKEQETGIGKLICGIPETVVWRGLRIHPITSYMKESVYHLHFSMLAQHNKIFCVIETDRRHESHVQSFFDTFVSILELLIQRMSGDVSEIMQLAREAIIDPTLGCAKFELATVAPLYLDAITQQLAYQSSRDLIVYACDIKSPLSAGDFLSRVRALALHLSSVYAIGKGDIVATMVPRGANSGISCLATLLAGGVYLPIESKLPIKRRNEILHIAGAKLVICDADSHGIPADVDVLNIEKWQSSVAKDPDLTAISLPTIDPTAPAYLIFTSGSTGKPKGALISHEAINNRLRWMQQQFSFGAGDVFIQKTPLTFDVSVWEILSPLLCGGKTVILAAGDEKNPDKITRMIWKHRVTIAHFVPTMLAIWLDSLSGRNNEDGLRICICSGEHLMPSHAEAFHTYFAGQCELQNLYGPTEAAIDVTYTDIKDNDVHIGSSAPGCRMLVLDDDDHPLPKGVNGHLWIEGIQVGLGYVGEPELTAQSFRPGPSGEKRYCTGDIAYWREDGNLALVGRLDSQIKLSGYRIELAEIEKSITGHPEVNQAVVLLAHENILVGFVQSSLAALDEQTLKSYLGNILPNYMIPNQILILQQLPLQPNGKVNRRELVQLLADNAASQKAIVPSNELEAACFAAWKRVLKVPVTHRNDDFFAKGGDSILALRLSAELRAKGYQCTVEHIFNKRTVGGIVQNTVSNNQVSLPFESAKPFTQLSEADAVKVPKPLLMDCYPLSLLQQNIIYQSLNSSSYEIYVTTLRIEAELNPPLMERAIDFIVDRHPFLRGAIDVTNYSELVQLIYREIPCSLQVHDITGYNATEQDAYLEQWLENEKNTPFEWHLPPLWRLHVHQLDAYTFQLTFSEVSMDGWCVATVLSELLEAYSRLLDRRTLSYPVIPIQYADFVAYERSVLQDPNHIQYWRRFVDEMQVTLVYDNPTFGVPVTNHDTRSNKRCRKVMVCEELDAIQALAKKANVPLKHVLLAVHATVMATLTGKGMISTGMEVNSRLESTGGDSMVGVFNNMVPLYVNLKNRDWLALSQHCFAIEQEVLKFRRFPYNEIRKLNGNNDLFDTLFVFTHFHNYQSVLNAQNLAVTDHYASDQTYIPLTVHFNLNVEGTALSLLLDYEAQKLTDDQAQGILHYYAEAIRRCTSQADSEVLNACLLSAQELEFLTPSVIECSSERTVQRMLCEALSQQQNQIAVIDGEFEYSFAQLDKFTDVLAGQLMHFGSSPALVLCGTSVEVVIAIVACVKLGIPYIPLDPKTPKNRLVQIAKDSGAGCYLSTAEKHELASLAISLVRVDVQQLQERPRPALTPLPVHPMDIVYIIYTSGTSGEAKGVAVPQRALVNYLHAALACYVSGNNGNNNIPLHGSLAFDMNVTPLYVALLSGACLHIFQDEDFYKTLLAEGTDKYRFVKLTPTQLELLKQIADASGQAQHTWLDKSCTMLLGGETLSNQTVESIHAEVINEYGPTETCVGCSVYPIKKAREPLPGGQNCRENLIPIGKAIPNMQVYVLNENLLPAPIGVPGQICIAGAGLAQGYVNQPSLTAEKFIPNPFSQAPGERLYLSGDIGIVRADGNILCVGRQDQQVKINGYRIELEDVANVALQHRMVFNAVAQVICQKEQSLLILFVIPVINFPFEPLELMSHLGEHLPAYMIPKHIMTLEALPLTGSGKLDRIALLNSWHAHNEQHLIHLLSQIESLSEEEVDKLLNDTICLEQGVSENL
ncbi:amino acid adenylation domain-containing protein [Rheinheimera baltica]|uniref:Amino acid adenylation domain-containing protein n=1 Tax=Rheinheimera baltica TaxID=67576 RepID=A0ABT9HUR2_9GAMM|nr:non-ribosomal peptide synthetase [Rheinheimera baltica]MDP5134748.1 amino acid adenylation domain-containing protein [Rheinheimera baltica]